MTKFIIIIVILLVSVEGFIIFHIIKILLWAGMFLPPPKNTTIFSFLPLFYYEEDKLSIPLRLQWILIILIIAGGIFIIGINIPYVTTEQYTDIQNSIEKVPYNVTENYTEKEAYTEPIYRGYLISEELNKGITYSLINVTSFSFNNTGKNFRGQNEYMYTVCYQIYCYNYSNITEADIKTDYVTNYREIQKSRNVTKYKDVQKSNQVNKTIYINLSLLQRVLQNNSLK